MLLGPPPVERGDVTRADTAAVLVALLDKPRTIGKVLEPQEGNVEIREAVAS